MDAKNRLRELALRALHRGEAQFMRFIDPSEQNEVRAAANTAGVRVSFFGGHPDAERCVAAFYSEDEPGAYPIETVEIRWNPKFSAVGHRDLMGAVMALGLERETLGDICLGREEGRAYVFCIPEMADYLIGALESAGRASVKTGRADKIDIAPPDGSETRATVQALRLDAVLAAGWNLSRGEAQKLIAAGLVKLNFAEETRADRKIEEGALISARGYGRVRVHAIEGETRRGRIAIRLFRYGK